MPGHGADRRPWLIISRREGQALLEALAQLERYDLLTPDMVKAGAQLRKQLAFISGHEGQAPTPEHAVEREDAIP
jgi:hypothetical protein